MKHPIAVTALVLIASAAVAQESKQPQASGSIRDIQDRIELRELVDTFSLLADKKEVLKQTALFTASATVETYRDGAVISRLSGREEIGKAFESFLKTFDTVYHFNGQHLVSLNGDRATGDLYCLTYLFGKESGKRVKTTFGIRYLDEYVRENGKWLIGKRTSFFEWQERDDTP